MKKSITLKRIREPNETKHLSIYARADRRTVASIIVFCILLIFSLWLIGLFLWAFLSSLKARLDFRSNLFGLPVNWMFSNFIAAFKELYVEIQSGAGSRNVYLWEMIFNSLLVSIVPPLFLLLGTSICMYTLAKYKFKGRNLIYNLFIIVMVLPIVGNLPSALQFQMSIGVYGKIWWMWLTAPAVWTGPWLILYAGFKTLSWEFAEAAFIDGAGHHRVFWTIMLPMLKTVILVLFLLQFISRWNDYQMSLIWLPKNPTLAFGLFMFQFSKAQIASSVTVQLAAAILAAIPSLILFIIFKDKMMGSLSVGGLKG